MSQRATVLLMIACGIVGLVGAVVSVVYFFQPWRTCSYEDTSAGCAMLPQDAAVLQLALGAAVVGVTLFVLGCVLYQTRRSQLGVLSKG